MNTGYCCSLSYSHPLSFSLHLTRYLPPSQGLFFPFVLLLLLFFFGLWWTNVCVILILKPKASKSTEFCLGVILQIFPMRLSVYTIYRQSCPGYPMNHLLVFKISILTHYFKIYYFFLPEIYLTISSCFAASLQ